jgi:hypothetical protein
MKKRILLILVLTTLLFSSLRAQQAKSEIKSALFSAVLPGAGEYYSQSKPAAFTSLAAETVLWLGYFGFLQQAKWAERDYKKFAYAYSESNITNGSDEYYNDLQHYFSSDVYNNLVRLYARDTGLGRYDWTSEEYNDFLEENLYKGDETWNWHSSDIWYRYGELRREKNKFKIIAKFTIGAMIANRVVSMIKAVRAASKYNKNLSTQKDLSFHIDFHPNKEKITLVLVKRF